MDLLIEHNDMTSVVWQLDTRFLFLIYACLYAGIAIAALLGSVMESVAQFFILICMIECVRFKGGPSH